MTSPTHQDKPVVVVTGSGGLLGTRICHALSEHYTICGVDLKEPESQPAGSTWIECDLTSDESTAGALSQIVARHGRRIASVIHLAAYYDFSGQPSRLYKDLTVEGTRRLLRGLQDLEVQQFVFSSSLLVMEPTDDDQEVLTEASSTEGEWAYPKSKLAAERVIRNEHGDVPAVVLRIAGVYDEDCHSIPIGQQITRIHQRSLESHFFPGDVEHGQPFVHLDDVVSCFERVVENRQRLEAYEVFLIAEEEVLSYEELQDLIGELIHGQQWTTVRIPKAMAKAGAWVKDNLTPENPFIKPWMVDLADDHYPVDVAKARETLGWQPTHALRDTLPEIIRRMQLDPQRWYAANGLGEPPAESIADVAGDPAGRRPGGG